MTGYSPRSCLGTARGFFYHSDEDFEYVGRVKYAENGKERDRLGRTRIGAQIRRGARHYLEFDAVGSERLTPKA
jgi:hypothetical protein